MRLSVPLALRCAQKLPRFYSPTMRQLKQLEDEATKLQKNVANLSLDK